MNHPTREEWMSYLYDEISRPAKAAFKTHLQNCPTCQKSLDEWRGVVQNLDAWALPKGRFKMAFVQPALKWAMAALFALGLGYGIGRFSVPSLDAATLRAGIENSLRPSLENEIRARLGRELADEVRSMVAASEASLVANLESLSAKSAAGSIEQTQVILSAYAAALKQQQTQTTQLAGALETLRKDTERMALLTAYGFQRNEQQLVQLATYNEPAASFPGKSGSQPNP